MKKLLVIFLLSIFIFPGCYESRRGYSERRGLMLLRTEEYARNQGVYKPAKKNKKNISKKVKREQKRRNNEKKRSSKAVNNSNNGYNSRGASGLGSR